MAYTLTQAQTMLDLYIAAETAILQGQSYTIKDRTLTRASLASVTKERARWAQIVCSLTRGGIGVKRAVPRDI